MDDWEQDREAEYEEQFRREEAERRERDEEDRRHQEEMERAALEAHAAQARDLEDERMAEEAANAEATRISEANRLLVKREAKRHGTGLYMLGIADERPGDLLAGIPYTVSGAFRKYQDADLRDHLRHDQIANLAKSCGELASGVLWIDPFAAGLTAEA